MTTAARADGLVIETSKVFELDGEFYDSETRDPDTGDLTDPHNFTGHEALFRIRHRRNEPESMLPILDATEASEITFPDPVAGQFRIEVDGATTALLPPGCYWYWLTFWPAGSPEDAFAVLEGRIDVVAGGGIGS